MTTAYATCSLSQHRKNFLDPPADLHIHLSSRLSALAQFRAGRDYTRQLTYVERLGVSLITSSFPWFSQSAAKTSLPMNELNRLQCRFADGAGPRLLRRVVEVRDVVDEHDEMQVETESVIWRGAMDDFETGLRSRSALGSRTTSAPTPRKQSPPRSPRLSHPMPPMPGHYDPVQQPVAAALPATLRIGQSPIPTAYPPLSSINHGIEAEERAQ